MSSLAINLNTTGTSHYKKNNNKSSIRALNENINSENNKTKKLEQNSKISSLDDLGVQIQIDFEFEYEEIRSSFVGSTKNKSSKVITFEEKAAQDEQSKLYEAAFAKAVSGEELSDEEMALVAKVSPVMYKIISEAKVLREVYAEQLKNCRSKEEVSNLKTAYDLASMKNIKQAKADGDYPEYVRQVTFKNTIQNEHDKFLESMKYKFLPNEFKK